VTLDATAVAEETKALAMVVSATSPQYLLTDMVIVSKGFSAKGLDLGHYKDS
jgi:hypothetical protein